MTYDRSRIFNSPMSGGELISDFDKYRRCFLILALFFFTGELFCICLYKYTNSLNDILDFSGQVDFDSTFGIGKCFIRYFDEIRYPLIVFASGFTLFAPALSSCFALYRGFVYGLTLVSDVLLFSDGHLSLVCLSAKLLTVTLICILEISSAAAACVNSSELRSVCPSFKDIFGRYHTHGFIIYFLLISAALFILTGFSYVIPLIFK